MESRRAAIKARILNAKQNAIMALKSAAADDSADTSDVTGLMVVNILLVVSLVVSLYFFPVLTSATATITSDTNTADRDATIIGLLPTIFVALLILGLIASVVETVKRLKA